MKYKASILFFCLLVYILELVALPAYCNPVPAQQPASAKESPCQRQAGNSCNRMAASDCGRKQADSPCQKPAKDCGNMADCCVNCPLCYVATIHSLSMPDKSSGLIKSDYPLHQSNYFFLYYTTAWKPPNGC